MKIIVTGGAGFIGANATARYLARGNQVVVFDNLSRKGTSENLRWLEAMRGRLTFIKGDIRDSDQVKALVEAHSDVDMVLHLAGQVAVTTSVEDPRMDFEINVLGTLNLLEAIRILSIRPVLLYASTNKVYGQLENIEIQETDKRYFFVKQPQGVSEQTQLDFHSPYGCSKGASEQYVRDYARMYNIPSVVLRQSCIYGPRQLGVEDQGWLAWFVIAAMLKKPIVVYGDGKQVRDILYVDDLLDCYDLCYEKSTVASGKIYNVGGGSGFSISIWKEFHPLLKEHFDYDLDFAYADMRTADQRCYVSDIRFIEHELGWTPKVGPRKGIALLVNWVRNNKAMLGELFGSERVLARSTESVPVSLV